MDSSSINIPNINELNIYEGGTLNEIKISDLMNNEIAIKQLINTHNLKINEIHNAQSKISSLTAEIEFQRTAPFISILALIINICGSTVGALGVNFLSATNPPQYSGLILFIGYFLVFVGSLGAILYPSARKYYNNKKEK
jgi:hypothetical protein